MAVLERTKKQETINNTSSAWGLLQGCSVPIYLTMKFSRLYTYKTRLMVRVIVEKVYESTHIQT